MLRHFIDLKDIAAADLRQILDLARAIKSTRKGLTNGALDTDPRLKGRALAMVFEQPSTRTRLSFEMAMVQAGGHALLMGDSQMGRGETVEDTVRVLSRMVDMVMIRARDHATVTAMADASDIPVINGLTNHSHPCQLMADVMTMEEQFGEVTGKTVAWLGDSNNVTQSLVEASVQFGFDLCIASPEGYQLSLETLDWAARRGHTVRTTHNAREAADGADVVMTDTWVSMGDVDADLRKRRLEPYRVDDYVMAVADPAAVFMHCLPAHRGDEVTDAVIDGPQSLVWQTAENRLHVQKAIMFWLSEQI